LQVHTGNLVLLGAATRLDSSKVRGTRRHCAEVSNLACDGVANALVARDPGHECDTAGESLVSEGNVGSVATRVSRSPRAFGPARKRAAQSGGTLG